MSNPDSNLSSKIIIAKWTDRFLAWLIDFVIISIFSTTLVLASFGSLEYDSSEDMLWAEGIQYIPSSIIFFSYWTILEYKTGQTIGKKILNLKITSINGDRPSLKGILISSFGKSFLLPIDVILGWVLTNEKRQRVFNKLGDTLVIKIKNSEEKSGVEYTKD